MKLCHSGCSIMSVNANFVRGFCVLEDKNNLISCIFALKMLKENCDMVRVGFYVALCSLDLAWQSALRQQSRKEKAGS